MTVDELVCKCNRREESAWNEFFRRYETLVRRAVYYKINRMNSKVLMSEADDIVQDVFLDLWKGNKLTKLRDISKLKSWLVVVTINKTSSYRKRRARNLFLTRSLSECMTDDGFTLEDIIPSRGMDPARAFEIKEMGEAIKSRMNKLRQKERIALELNLLGNEKHSRIAEIMDVPVNTVTSLIHRGKGKNE